MAVRKRRKRVKRRKSTAKKATATRKRRRARKANPAKRRSARRTRSNPRRRRATSTRKRSSARRANPGRRRARRSNPRRSSARRRRNPGGPIVDGLIAAGIALAGFLAVNAIAIVATPSAEMVAKAPRNRMLAAAVVGGAGAYLAKTHPMYGAGLMAGASIAAIGNALMVRVIPMLPTSKAPAPAPTMKGVFQTGGMAGVMQANMSGVRQLGTGDNLGAVTANIGDVGVAAIPPWRVASPFG